MSDNTQLIFKMYESFGKGDMDTIRNELFHPDISWTMPGHHPLSATMRGVDEEQVAARFNQSGTHSGVALMGMEPSGRRAEWTEIGVLKIERGKIVESWYEVDMLSMIQQLSGDQEGS
jgi:hypothetical protein